MKILWLTENYPPRRGGMAQACDRITHNLRQQGIELDILLFSELAKGEKIVQQQGGTLVVIPANLGSGHTLNTCWNYLTRPNIDNKYTHIIAFGGNLPMLALPVFHKWLKCKAITMIRGNDFDLGIFSHSRRQIILEAFNTSAVVSVLTKDQEIKIRAYCPATNIARIPNGIDIDDWQPTASDIASAAKWKKTNCNQKTKVIGLIGQLKPKKGGLFFLKNIIAANLADKFHILLIGDIDKQMEECLEQYSSTLKITKLPFQDRWQLLAWYPACDFIALPSFYDGMPNVLLESALLGIPTIGASTGGIVDIIDSSNGFLFHPGDKLACRKCLWQASQLSTDAQQAMGKATQNKIKTEYNSEIETKNYISMLNKTL